MIVLLFLLGVESRSTSFTAAQEAAGEPAKAKPRTVDPAKTGKTSTKSPRTPADSSAGRDDAGAPRVLTKQEAEARKRKRSEFLGPPRVGSVGQDHYLDDEEELPPWRQASFFGIQARGQFFVFVVDQSGSMIDEGRLYRAKTELRRSVFALQASQRFEVIFYNDVATPMPGGPLPRSADQKSKNQLMSWLRLIDPDGGTDPERAIGQAIALRPDAIFLLSDGEFPDATVDAVARLNTTKIPIHCVDLSASGANGQLARIAQSSGGQFAARPGGGSEIGP
jgi:hypothetical protein